MAPLPHNGTDIVYVDYSVNGHDHTVECRVAGAGAIAQFETDFAAIVGAMNAVLDVTTFLGARHSVAGSNISVPFTWGGPTGWGSTAGLEGNSAAYYDFVGRSTTGRRCRFALFGAIDILYGDNYRATETEAVWVTTAVAAMNGSASDFLAIDGSKPIWYSYANTGVNAYWRNKIR